MELYKLFIKKIPAKLDDFHPVHCKAITFLNPYSFNLVEKEVELLSHFDIIASDGILITSILNFFKEKEFQVKRFSFDMTSVAPYVLTAAQKEKYDVYFLGTEERFINSTVQNLKQQYPELIISGFRHGYFNNLIERENFIKSIVVQSPKIVIIGMGAPLQENMGVLFREFGYKGSIYTCGGFLHQTSDKIQYYPEIVDKLNLRLPYRMLKEPNLFWRSVKSYPLFFIKFLYSIIRSKIDSVGNPEISSSNQ